MSDLPPARETLERRTYRRQRLGDAARLLPVVAAVLFGLPLIGAGGGGTAGAVLYLFVCWAVLIVVTALISQGLGRDEGRGDGR